MTDSTFSPGADLTHFPRELAAELTRYLLVPSFVVELRQNTPGKKYIAIDYYRGIYTGISYYLKFKAAKRLISGNYTSEFWLRCKLQIENPSFINVDGFIDYWLDNYLRLGFDSNKKVFSLAIKIKDLRRSVATISWEHRGAIEKLLTDLNDITNANKI